MNNELRFLIEIVAFVLSVVLVLLAGRLARRLRRLGRAELSAEMFLLAPLIREFLFAFALAVALFVTMPISILGYLLTDEDVLEVVHDVSHLLFLVVVLVGVLGLRRLGRKDAEIQGASRSSVDVETTDHPRT